jgi:hypothetical protein
MIISTIPTIARNANGTAVVWFATLEFISEEKTKASIAKLAKVLL